MAQGQLKSRYDVLTKDRNVFLDRAREAAKLTLPSLIPPEGANSSTEYETPWQSIGSRGVNNLASKILLALFPPSSPFFRMGIDEPTLAALGAKKSEAEKQLAAFERVIMSDIEDSRTRASLFQSAKHLIVAGNALLFNTPTGEVRMYPLSRYVTKRDAEGNTYEIIAVDNTVFGALSPAYQEAAIAAGVNKNRDDDVMVYTGIFRDSLNGQWTVHQEIEGVVVPGSNGTYPLDASPWIPLRMVAIDGESYGRGYVEEIYGDLNTLDALTQAITEAAAAGAVVKFLVNPNGVTDIDDVTDTENGGFCEGKADDITVLQVGKFADLRVANETITQIEARLSQAFLLHSSVQRNAERVTAEEIRFMASELEDALGGIYSVLAQELQLPMVKHRIVRLTKMKKLPPLPQGVKPAIITGLEALGRSQELQRLRMFIADAGQTFGPEAVVEYVSVGDYLTRSAAALNIPTEGLVRPEEEVQARQKQRAEQAAQLQAAASTATQGGQ